MLSGQNEAITRLVGVEGRQVDVVVEDSRIVSHDLSNRRSR